MWSQISKVALEAVDSKTFPGCVVGILDNGECETRAFGSKRYDEDLVFPDSIFDVASVTKVVPTSTLALKLLEEGKIKLDDQVISYLPEFRNSERGEVLIRHLLTQTLDYNFRLSAYKDASVDEILDVIMTTDFKRPPGSHYYYTNATSILLGLVVERVFEKPLDELAHEYIFEPLGMTDSHLKLEGVDTKRIVPTEFDDWRGREICGEIHDESAWKLREKIIAGSAGLFSTSPDLLKFLKGVLEEKLHSKKILEMVSTNQTPDLQIVAGLGWELNQPCMGKNAQRRIGKTGFTGCVIMLDIDLKKGLVILSNYTYPHRKPNASQRNAFFEQISNIVFA